MDYHVTPVEPLPTPTTAAAILRRLWAMERALDRFNLGQIGRSVRWDVRQLTYRPLTDHADHALAAAIGNHLLARVWQLAAAAQAAQGQVQSGTFAGPDSSGPQESAS